MYLTFGTHKVINFPFGTNGKFIILHVPVFKHIMVHLVSKKRACFWRSKFDPLSLFHSDKPKFYTVLAFPSAVGLRVDGM